MQILSALDLHVPEQTTILQTMREPNTIERASLEEIAMLSMEFGRLRMESGASAHYVEDIVAQVARGLGAERVDLRIGYASLAVTVGIGDEGITRMRKIGPLGVNQRLDHALKALAARVERNELSAAETRAELDRMLANPPRFPGWLVDLAVGAACASFGRLLGVDWLAVGPIFVAATVGQWFRRELAIRHVNVFISATLVAFLGSALSGLGARIFSSGTVQTAMTAAVLLLVPGVPSFNAQVDILDGRPTLGSARAVWVGIILVFLTVGVWLGQMFLGEAAWPVLDASPSPAHHFDLARLIHQMLFGGVAAIGFGVLFNIGPRTLSWCGVCGGLALAIRMAGLELGWSLEAASFAAALVVGGTARLIQDRAGISRNTLGVAGCIPMIPGGFAAKAILGLFLLTTPAPQAPDQILIYSAQNALRVIFTIGTIGTGLAIPSMLTRLRKDK
jgi:uncharacterized membrane protein YjjP (DUF1212 family)